MEESCLLVAPDSWSDGFLIQPAQDGTAFPHQLSDKKTQCGLTHTSLIEAIPRYSSCLPAFCEAFLNWLRSLPPQPQSEAVATVLCRLEPSVWGRSHGTADFCIPVPPVE